MPHTHTHMHKTDFSIVDADNDASELKVSHNSSRDKRVLVFNKNILSYWFTWYTEHWTEPVWNFFAILYVVEVYGTVNAVYFLWHILCKNKICFWLDIGLSYEDLQIHRHIFFLFYKQFRHFNFYSYSYHVYRVYVLWYIIIWYFICIFYCTYIYMCYIM